MSTTIKNTLSRCGLGLWYLIFSVVPLLVVHSSFAQSADEVKDIEEIVVTEKRSISSLREEVWFAEEEVFELFNEIYAGTDYEMTCKRERPVKDPLNPIPNSWSVRVCRSRLAQDLYEQEMKAYGEYIYAEENGDVGILPDTASYINRTEAHREDLFQKVRDLLVENPEYREKFQEYATAKKTYDAAVEADYEESIFTKLSNWLGFKKDRESAPGS